ncbi:MAG: hypothetical protein WCT08_02425 [Patescibacteria group bacterium]|jgi:hypothetical protein
MLLYLFIVIFIIIVGSAAWAVFKGAPWVPTWQYDYQRILDFVDLKEDETIFELGAGDARLLPEFAKTKAKSIIGFEISVLPYIFGWFRVRKLKPRVKFKFKDFYKADFSQANVIFCFLTAPAMKKLKIKFEKECQPGTRIVSYTFSIPDWKLEAKDKPTEKSIPIYKYIFGQKNG